MKQYLTLNHKSISSFEDLSLICSCILEYRDAYNEIEENNDPHKQDNAQEETQKSLVINIRFVEQLSLWHIILGKRDSEKFENCVHRNP